MTFSNDHQDSTVPDPAAAKRQTFAAGEHWFEMTASLSAESTAVFADWIDRDLAVLQDELSEFVTNDSLKQSLRR